MSAAASGAATDTLTASGINASEGQDVAAWAVALVMALQPAAVLIDHGHFQYNNISLGLTVRFITACTLPRPARAFLIHCSDHAGSCSGGSADGSYTHWKRAVRAGYQSQAHGHVLCPSVLLLSTRQEPARSGPLWPVATLRGSGDPWMRRHWHLPARLGPLPGLTACRPEGMLLAALSCACLSMHICMWLAIDQVHCINFTLQNP